MKLAQMFPMLEEEDLKLLAQVMTDTLDTAIEDAGGDNGWAADVREKFLWLVEMTLL